MGSRDDFFRLQHFLTRYMVQVNIFFKIAFTPCTPKGKFVATTKDIEMIWLFKQRAVWDKWYWMSFDGRGRERLISDASSLNGHLTSVWMQGGMRSQVQGAARNLGSALIIKKVTGGCVWVSLKIKKCYLYDEEEQREDVAIWYNWEVECAEQRDYIGGTVQEPGFGEHGFGVLLPALQHDETANDAQGAKWKQPAEFGRTYWDQRYKCEGEENEEEANHKHDGEFFPVQHHASNFHDLRSHLSQFSLWGL